MSKPESLMRAAVNKALRNRGLHVQAVENEEAGEGTPDVNYAGRVDGLQGGLYLEGWIELKRLVEWPKRPGTITRVDKLTLVQRCWLHDRWQAGGAAFLLLRVGTTVTNFEWLLFSGPVAHRTVGRVPRLGLYNTCLARHAGALDGAWLAVNLHAHAPRGGAP